MRTMLALAFGVLFCVVAATPVRGAEDELDVIRARMAERQERAQTFVYEWTVDRSVQQGLFNFVQHRFEESPAEAADAPPEDTPVNEAFRLVVDGQDFRVDMTEQAWSVTKRKMVPSEMSLARSEHGSWSYMESLGRLIVGYDAVDRITNTPDLRPPLLVYRPFDEVLGLIRPEGLRLVGEEELGGLDCALVEFEQPLTTFAAVWRMWLARDMGYVPVHWERSGPRGVTERTDLSYAEDDELGWRLTGWRVVRYQGDPGTYNNTFTEATVNEPVDAGLFMAFAQDFPHDTVLVAQSPARRPGPYGPREGEATAEAEPSEAPSPWPLLAFVIAGAAVMFGVMGLAIGRRLEA